MTLTLAAQLLVSTEVLLTLGVVGALVLLAAFLAVPAHRSAIARTAVLLAISCVGVAILASPLLFLAFHHSHVSPEYAAHGAPADLLSWVVPSPTWQALAAGAHPYAGGFGYLGLPLVVLLLLAGAQLWRSPGARVALLAVAIASIASLGASLRVGGHDTGIPLPWTLLDDLPLLRYALPIRLSVFVFLPAAVLVAMWLARGGGSARWGLALLAVVTLLPNVLGSTVWRIDVHDPPFFASGAYRRVLSPSDRVLVLPAAGENMRWQADSKFRFRMVGGGWAAVPPGYARQPIWWKLALGTATPADAGALRRFVDDRGATAIVLDPTHPTLPRTYRTLVDRLGVRPRAIGGVLVYRLRPAPPSG